MDGPRPDRSIGCGWATASPWRERPASRNAIASTCRCSRCGTPLAWIRGSCSSVHQSSNRSCGSGARRSWRPSFDTTREMLRTSAGCFGGRFTTTAGVVNSLSGRSASLASPFRSKRGYGCGLASRSLRRRGLSVRRAQKRIHQPLLRCRDVTSRDQDHRTRPRCACRADEGERGPWQIHLRAFQAALAPARPPWLPGRTEAAARLGSGASALTLEVGDRGLPRRRRRSLRAEVCRRPATRVLDRSRRAQGRPRGGVRPFRASPLGGAVRDDVPPADGGSTPSVLAPHALCGGAVEPARLGPGGGAASQRPPKRRLGMGSGACDRRD